MLSPSRIITSYLGNPLVRDPRPGVLRAGICQRSAWYAGRQDIRIADLVPTAEVRKEFEAGLVPDESPRIEEALTPGVNKSGRLAQRQSQATGETPAPKSGFDFPAAYPRKRSPRRQLTRPLPW